MPSSITDNAKALLAVAFAAAGAMATALEGDNTISIAEWVAIAIFVLGSGGVTWWVSKSQYAKAIVASMGAALVSMYAAVEDEIITRNEWMLIIVAALGALVVVYRVPNTGEDDDVVP